MILFLLFPATQKEREATGRLPVLRRAAPGAALAGARPDLSEQDPRPDGLAEEALSALRLGPLGGEEGSKIVYGA